MVKANHALSNSALDAVIITQLNRRFSYVPNLIREVTALRWDVWIKYIWGETVLFIIQTSERMRYFTIFQEKSTQSMFRTINRGLLAKPLKKFPKSPILPAGSHF